MRRWNHRITSAIRNLANLSAKLNKIGAGVCVKNRGRESFPKSMYCIKCKLDALDGGAIELNCWFCSRGEWLVRKRTRFVLQDRLRIGRARHPVGWNENTTEIPAFTGSELKRIVSYHNIVCYRRHYISSMLLLA